MDRVRKQIHYEYVEKLGLTGKDITICVLDTGISAHYDFDHRILEYIDFTSGHKNYIHDESGHGTHVCGILAGSGKASHYLYKGIANRANLVVLKILNRHGNGQIEDLFSALEWIVQNHKNYQIKIVNISIAIPQNSSLHYDRYKQERLRDLLYRLYKSNIFIVAAAGNEGPKENSISVLGNQKYTLCVGCHDGNFKKDHTKLCGHYSGRGQKNSLILKPDVVAPGTDIVSCSHDHAYGYVKKSGTSMACPIVSGIIALLCEQSKAYHVDDIANKIRSKALSLDLPRYQQGYGMIDCEALFKK